MTLTEFLLARIAEDEAVARAAVGTAVFSGQTGRWSFETVHDQYGPIPIVFAVADSGAKTQVADLSAAWEREERGAHIARYDPARVLAKCEAMRRIVARHSSIRNGWSDDDGEPTQSCTHDWKAAPCPDLRDLASVYADHPDYDEDWKP